MNVSISPLLRTPEPNNDESYRGYILRLSEQNGCNDPAKLFMYAGMSRLETRKDTQPVELVAALTGKRIGDFDGILNESPLESHWFGRLLGHPVDKFSLKLKSPKVCTECIKELGYIPSRWDLDLVNVCHIHRRELIRFCSKCDKKLKWFRPGILVCKCLQTLDDVGEMVEANDLLDFTLLVCSIIERRSLVDDESSSGMPFTLLSKIPLIEFLGLVKTLGDSQLKVEGSDGLFGLYGINSIHGITRKAAFVLSNWPNNLYKLFEQNIWFQVYDPRLATAKNTPLRRLFHQMILN